MLVRVLPGTSTEAARDALAECLRELKDIRGRGVEPLTTLQAPFSGWVHRSQELLRGRISTRDVDHLVMTQRVLQIQQMPDTGNLFTVLREMVRSEIDQRVHDIESAMTHLRAEIERWGRPGRLIAADTSFFIQHDTTLKYTVFADLLGVRGTPLRLLIPMVVIDELDQLKQTGREGVRGRARHTLAELNHVFRRTLGPALLREEDSSPVRSGGIPRGQVTADVLLDPPGHQRLPINDDEIVDRLLAVQTYAQRPVTLITYDTGETLRARASGLEAVHLPKSDD